MKFTLSSILLLSVLVLSAQNKYFDSAYSLFAKNRYLEAEDLFTKSIKNEPLIICDALRIRAVTRILLSDSVNAFLDIEEATKLCPDNANVYYSKGVMFSLTKNYKKAISNYTKAIQLNPKRIDFYINRSLGNGMEGDTLAFIKDALFAISLDSSSSQANSNLAYYYKNTGRFTSAIPYFEKAMIASPFNVDILVALVECHFNLRHFEQALEICNIGIKLKSTDHQMAEILVFRGQINMEMKNKEQACEDFKKANTLSPAISEKHLLDFCH